MQQISFRIEYPPTPASRPRIFKNGGRSYSASHLAYKKFLETGLQSDVPAQPLDGPLEASFTFICPRPKKTVYEVPRADLDNLCKLPLDCMTASGYWHDDYQITRLVAEKRYAEDGETPHTLVVVRTATI